MAYKFQLGSAKLGGAIESTGNITGVTGSFGDVTDPTAAAIVAQIDNNEIPGAKLVNDSVTAAQIAADAITASELADNAVDRAAILNDAVDGSKIADDSIDSAHYVDGSIDLAHMSANSVDSDQYVDGSIDTAHIADDQITNALMADDAIDSDQLAAGSVDLAHMSANSVDSDQYVDGSIDLAHMSANSVDSDQYVDGSIDTVHIADAQITLAKMAANSVDSDQYVDGSIDTAHYAAGSVNPAALANNAVETAKILDLNVTLGKMANVADGRFLMGNASNRPVAVAASGDALISNAGLVSIQSGRVSGSMLNANVVAAGKGTELDGSQIAVKLASAGALVLEAGGLDLKATIAGDKTFSGDMIVSGDLTVNGTTTTLNVAELSVEDANITMAKGATAADGHGLTIGTTGTPVTLMLSDSAANLASSLPLKASEFKGNLTGNLTTPRNIGGVAFNASIDIVPRLMTVADESADTTCNVAFFNAATGDQQAKTGTNLTFNSAAGSLAATEFVGGGAGLTGVTIRDVVVSKSANYTVLNSDTFRTILIDAQGGSVRITLPAAGGANSGKIFKLKRIDASGNDCEVIPASGEKLEFSVDQILALQTQGAAVSCISNGTDWFAM